MADRIIHLDEDVHTRAKEFCVAENTTLKEYVTDLINRDLDQRRKEVEKRSLPPTVYGGDPEVASKPPFWAARGRK